MINKMPSTHKAHWLINEYELPAIKCKHWITTTTEGDQLINSSPVPPEGQVVSDQKVEQTRKDPHYHSPGTEMRTENTGSKKLDQS